MAEWDLQSRRFLKEVREMMDMNGMMDRCMDVMGSMMGSGTMLVVLMVLLPVFAGSGLFSSAPAR
jgi:hypothetical protein